MCFQATTVSIRSLNLLQKPTAHFSKTQKNLFPSDFFFFPVGSTFDWIPKQKMIPIVKKTKYNSLTRESGVQCFRVSLTLPSQVVTSQYVAHGSQHSGFKTWTAQPGQAYQWTRYSSSRLDKINPEQQPLEPTIHWSHTLVWAMPLIKPDRSLSATWSTCGPFLRLPQNIFLLPDAVAQRHSSHFSEKSINAKMF